MFICAAGDIHGAMNRLYRDVFAFLRRLDLLQGYAKRHCTSRLRVGVHTEHGRGKGMAKRGLDALARALAAAMIAALCGCHQDSAHAPPAAPAPPVKAADINAERLAAGGTHQKRTPPPGAHRPFFLSL